MRLTKYDWISIAITILLFASAIYVYPTLSDKIPIHWNASGEVDGWGAPQTIFLFPAIVALIYGLFLAIPRIAVYKKNIQGFKHFESMKLALVVFLSAFYLATFFATIGYDFKMNYVFMPIMAFLFIYLGYILKDIKRNFFIGIRTPWTLASDVVWKKTHELGGKVFVKLGILMLVGVFVPTEYLLWFILLPIFVAVFIMIAYSYVVWKQEGKKSL
jgi:uncharacterized membrane protein